MVNVGDIYEAPSFYQGKYYQVTNVDTIEGRGTTARLIPVRKGDFLPYNRSGGVERKKLRDGALGRGWVLIKPGEVSNG